MSKSVVRCVRFSNPVLAGYDTLTTFVGDVVVGDDGVEFDYTLKMADFDIPTDEVSIFVPFSNVRGIVSWIEED